MRREWTKVEINYLIDNYPFLSNKELSIFLNRSEKNLRSKASKLKLKKSSDFLAIDGKDWTEKEVNILILNYSEMRSQDLCKLLNRSIKSINKKSYVLGLKKSVKHKSNMTSKRNKIVARDLNYDNLKEISSKYKSRGEFQLFDSSAYQAARRMNILDDICSHMIKQSFSIPQLILKFILSKLINDNLLYNTRQIIKPYELDIYFPEYNLAFEYNGKGWHTNDKIDKSEICNKNGIKLFTILENNRSYEKDIKNQLIDIIDELNEITNKKNKKEDIENILIDGSLFEEIINRDYIKSICDNYINYSDFRKENINLYNKLRKLKVLEFYTKHMKRNLVKWNIDKAIEEVRKYEYLGDFISNSNGCYHWIKKNKKEYLLEFLKLKQNKKLKYS